MAGELLWIRLPALAVVGIVEGVRLGVFSHRKGKPAP
jgi:hypothetical protein